MKTNLPFERQASRLLAQPLLLILLLAVLLRLVVAIYLGDSVPPAKDEQSYSILATRLVAGHGFSFAEGWYPFAPAGAPTAHWSFLYTAFVAAIYAVAGPHPLAVRLVGALLGGLLLPWLSYRLSQRLWPGSSTLPLLSAGLTAVYAFFILYAAMLMTETFYIAALLWSLERALALRECWRGGRRAGQPARAWPVAIQLGVALGLAALLRQSVLPWVVVLFAWLLSTGLGRLAGWRAGRLAGWKVDKLKGWPVGELKAVNRLTGHPVTSLFLAGTIMTAMILPFTVRNYLAYGHFLLLNSNAGYAMYSAQHPLHGTSFQAFAAAPLPAELLGQGLTEPEWDRELMRRGLGFVLADPLRYLRLSASRLADYFEFWPTDTSWLHNAGRLLSFTLLAPFMIAGLALAVRRELDVGEGDGDGGLWGSPVGLALLFIIFYSLLHIFTWAMPRYRLPVDAVALPFAALALREAGARLSQRRVARPQSAGPQATN